METALTALGYPGLPRSTAAQVLAVLGQVLVRVAQRSVPALFVGKERGATDRSPSRASLAEDLLAGAVTIATLLVFRGLYDADRTTPSPAMARGYGMMAAIVVNSPLKGLARSWADRAVEVAERLGSPATLTYALHRGAVAYVVLGDWTEATRRFERALSLSDAHGDRRRWEESAVARAICHLARGRFAACSEDAFASLASATARDDKQTTAWSRALLLEALARQARDQELAVIEAETLGDTAPLGDAERTWIQAALAIARLLRGDEAGAALAADAALAIIERSPPVGYFMGTPIASLTEATVRLWERAARDGTAVAAARERALRSRDALVGLGRMLSFVEPFVLTWRGSVDWQDGRASLARRRWEKAMEAAQRLDMWQAEAQVLFEVGRHVEGDGRHEALAAAAERFNQAGAVRDRRRALDALP